MSTASTGQGPRGPRYRRRRPLPALILLAVLVVLSGFVWTRVFESTESVEMATRCNVPGAEPGSSDARPGKPPTETAAGTMLSRKALNDTTPVPPQDVSVRVLNANGKVNQATLVSEELSNLGFGRGGSPGNDSVYTEMNLKCHAQIRYGEAGARAARTLSLIAPCAQLVRDQRSDASIDLALGSEFDGVKATQEGHQTLQQLKNWAKQSRGQTGDRTQAAKPGINPELLKAARDVHC
ncbi:envelope integrity protein Cei [Actinopolyspora saharensis]|uniref:LytR cell envelope-related transcriptional attenuator n=1 Tax=Actinopolyspora saharensis TaxID=995062 RepID=A0A1H0XYN0_9ACTN|nr:envelope integrity protein Cei [Actinopolyspora saharensis]SDQ08008.1 LytR cell envelope-related transcriptional attenuator [Actinopolyspora saharensis]